MKFRYMELLLPCCLCLMLLAGCGAKNTESSSENPNFADDANSALPVESATEENASPEAEQEATQKTIPISQTKSDGSSDIHITVQNVEVSAADLKDQDYIVPVYVTLDENSGISYVEWGIQFDERCAVTADSDDDMIKFETLCSVNDDKHFLWAAWASAETKTRTGGMLLLHVQLPEDAAPGDFYSINYASMSLVNKPHVWETSQKSYVTDGYISWTDGGITVTE